MPENSRRVVLGVTAPTSLGLMRGLPEHLAAQGWDVHVVSAPGPALESLGNTSAVTIHGLTMDRDPAPLRDLRSLVAWVRLLRSLRPEIVFVGTPKAGLLGTVAAALTRVPIRLYHMRGLRLETTRGVARLILTLLERATFGASTGAVAVSVSLRNRLIELGLTRADKVVVLGRGSSNGVDTTRFRPAAPGMPVDLRAELGLNRDVPVIGYVGRIHRDKGVQVLLEASAMLMQRGIDHRIVVIGRSEDPVIQKMIEQLPPQKRPLVVGPVEDTAPYYHVMDILCLPTFREGFPNVVLEAAASGIPVVTTDATGAVDSVLPGRTGAIAIAGSSISLADQLGLMLTDSRVRVEFGRNAREFAVEDFSRATVWSNTVQYLSELASTVSASRG
ncbi:MAG: glycosyltransferase family 4 protein [Microbacteriaceae bacterium]|uniref:glycosyltransferase family 4 protein n=1 Tax=Microbacterium gubbeenense TaxID=159896 RepID=UPI003F9DA7E6